MTCTCGAPANLDRPDLLGHCDEVCRDWAVLSAQEGQP